MPIFVNAEPLYQGTDFAIWRGEDIPPGVMRGMMCASVEGALCDVVAGGCGARAIPQLELHVVLARDARLVAAVASCHMQKADAQQEPWIRASGPRIIDADEVYKRGTLAVWRLKDIPVGVLRHGMSTTDLGALAPGSLVIRASQMPNDQKIPGYAAVAWADLQPKTPVPRGRSSMPADCWGTNRDGDGICTICHADDSMWCDDVAHKQAYERKQLQSLAKLYAPDLSKVDTLRARMMLQPDTATQQQSSDRLLAAGMGAAWGERWPHKPSVQEQAAWSRELRRLTAASAERERNRVLVDLEFEPWE